MSIEVVINILVGLVAVEHIYFMILEMFLWKTPKACKAFGMTPEFAQSTASLAANQGLYNGFMASGLIWSLLVSDLGCGSAIKIFFTSCLFVAGVYGGFTVNKRIFFLQGVPSLITLGLVLYHNFN